MIPITLRVVRHNYFKPGPFSLGRFGIPVALIACLWLVFASIVLLLPTEGPTLPASNDAADLAAYFSSFNFA